MNRAVEIIAEAGVNHNGEVARALALVDAAADSGADTVKFQTFEPGELASRHALQAPYQTKATSPNDGQLEMLSGLALDAAAHQALLSRCRDRGVGFLSTPFDSPSLSLLVGTLGQRRVKIGSGDLTNGPLLLEAARAGVDLILSTGMATIDEISEALGVIAFGFAETDTPPSRGAFARAFEDSRSGNEVRNRVVLLQCTSAYPTRFEEANIRAMELLSRTFGCAVGFSDHTIGCEAAIAAVALGATVIEKHVTLDRGLPGPDHQSSIEPGELAAMAAAVRNVELALGAGEKTPTPGERENMAAARKSLVARTAIRRGEPFTPENLAVKRPGGGVPPVRYWDRLGEVAERDYQADEIIDR